MKSAPRLLRLERLEDRTVPALFGVPWADSSHLTLSFVPDGTVMPGGGNSSLFATFNEVAPTSVWQGEVLRALETWTGNAGIQLNVVADNGDPLGTAGAVQGDSRFGDIRIAATAMGDDVIGTGTPFGWSGSTFSGDIFLNTRKSFSIGGGTGDFDLYTVLLQETGHALGLDNSPNTSSVMYTQYLGTRSGLDSGDVTAIQSLYGTPVAGVSSLAGDLAPENSPKVDNDNHSNDTFAKATTLETKDQSDPRFDFFYRAVIRDYADADFYRVRVPWQHQNGAVNLVVLVWSEEVGGLDPRIRLYDSQKKPISFHVLSNDRGLMSVQVGNVAPASDLYVQVIAREATDRVHNTGAYSLALDFGHKPLLNFDSVGAGTLTALVPQNTAPLTVAKGSLIEFNLSATSSRPSAGVTMKIVDENGYVVATIVSKAGQPAVTRTLYLAAGKYTVKYAASGATSLVKYRLGACIISDNIGPYATTTSSGGSPAPTSGYSYTGAKTTWAWGSSFWF